MATLTVYQGRDLPPIIQRAITRVNDPAVLQDLSPAHRWAISLLLRRVSASDGQDIFWVKRENFAKLIGASQATVYRILSALERLGLIQRVSQKRSAEGEFTVGELRLSDGLCRLLGLTLPSVEPDKSTLYTRSKGLRFSAMQDGVSSNQEKAQFSSKKHSPSEPVDNSVRKPKVPQDLQVLLDRGLTAPQLFKLMALASSSGKRLSDIVMVCQEQLQPLQRTELFAYIRTLTSTEKDFAFINLSKARERADVELRKREKETVTRLFETHKDRWLSQGGDTLFRIDSEHVVSVYRNTGNGWECAGAMAGEAVRRFWQRVDEGDFTEANVPPYLLH